MEQIKDAFHRLLGFGRAAKELSAGRFAMSATDDAADGIWRGRIDRAPLTAPGEGTAPID
jgi:hypothetical protein